VYEWTEPGKQKLWPCDAFEDFEEFFVEQGLPQHWQRGVVPKGYVPTTASAELIRNLSYKSSNYTHTVSGEC